MSMPGWPEVLINPKDPSEQADDCCVLLLSNGELRRSYSENRISVIGLKYRGADCRALRGGALGGGEGIGFAP